MAGVAGRSGRRPKPIEQHLIDGTYRADRHGPLAGVLPICTKPKAGKRRRPAKRWITDPSDILAVEQGYWFEHRLGKYACNWIEKNLQLVEGIWSGKPFTLLPWQRDIVMHLFGWVRFDREWEVTVRRFRRALIVVPKKNGKSPFAAALALYLAFGDNTQLGNDVAVIATDKIQASNVGKHAIRMIRRTAWADRFSTNENLGRILNVDTESVCRTMAHNPNQLEGLNLSGCICDELHVWRDSRVWDTILYAGASRPDFLHVAITTAGDDIQSLCHHQYDYCKSIQAGTIEQTNYFSRIYEASLNDDWTRPSTWKKANPSLGYTIKRRELEAACNEAKHNTRLQAAFKRYRLNIWSQPEHAWLDMAYWDECRVDYGIDDVKHLPCWIGLDLAKTQDMTAANIVFADDNDIFWQWPLYWMPEQTAKKRSHEHPYLQWAEAGLLSLTPGDVMDYGYVFDEISRLSEQLNIQSVVYDPWNAEHFTQQLEADLGLMRLAFQQTIRTFSFPTSEYERRVINATLKHPGHKVLDWQASHVLVKTDINGNIRPVKRAEGDHRTIDGVVAGIMALSEAVQLGISNYNYYESHDVEFV